MREQLLTLRLDCAWYKPVVGQCFVEGKILQAALCEWKIWSSSLYFPLSCVACYRHCRFHLTCVSKAYRQTGCFKAKPNSLSSTPSRGLIPTIPRPHSPLCYPFWKALWLEVDLKLATNLPNTHTCTHTHPTLPFSPWDFLESPKLWSVYQHQGIRQYLHSHTSNRGGGVPWPWV